MILLIISKYVFPKYIDFLWIHTANGHLTSYQNVSQAFKAYQNCPKLNSIFTPNLFFQCLPSPVSAISKKIVQLETWELFVILSISNSLSCSLLPLSFQCLRTYIKPVHFPISHYCYSSLSSYQLWYCCNGQLFFLLPCTLVLL